MMYDSKQLAIELKRKLRHVDISKMDLEEVNTVGLQVLKVQPKDRCDKQILVVKRMTQSNKFFMDMIEQYGKEIYDQMVRYCYLE